MQKDPVLPYLINKASKATEIQRLVLFGSRAMGTAQERSDYDVAVSAPKFNHEDWSTWAESVRDHIPTLCGIDLIWIESVTSEELKKKISEEGKVFYERK